MSISSVPVVEVVVDQSTPVLEGNGVNVTVQRSLVTDITTSVQITTVQTNRSTTLTTGMSLTGLFIHDYYMRLFMV